MDFNEESKSMINGMLNNNDIEIISNIPIPAPITNGINKKFPSKTTYISIGTEDTGLLEIDLVTFRQKNDEMRYLSIMFKGLDARNGESQDAFINIDNEDAFNELKKFFAQLEWNS